MPVGLKTMINDEAFDRYVYDQDLYLDILIYIYIYTWAELSRENKHERKLKTSLSFPG